MLRNTITATDHDIYSLILGEYGIGCPMNSPLPPTDDNPSFWIYRKGDDLLWHDARITERYDRRAIGLAVRLWGCSYTEAYSKIRRSDIPKIEVVEKIVYDRKVICGDSYEDYERVFWDTHCVSSRQLFAERCYPLRGYYIDNEIIMSSRESDPVYVYQLEKGWQVYRPSQPRTRRFKSIDIGGVLFGYDIAQTGGDMFITSSNKDRIVLKSLGYQAVAPSSETVHRPILERYPEMRLRWRNIYVLFDNDEVGIRSMRELCKGTEMVPVVLRSAEKDPADIIRRWGIDGLKYYIS
jgi:hypothetical protein